MDNKLRILTIEDESNIRRFVKLALETEGYEVFEADGLKRGLIEAGTRRPDLVVLDLGLPDGDGLDFITDLRNWSDIPVIVLSARNSEHDKISALDAGADDYVPKPFGMMELLARVRALLRRSGGKQSQAEYAVGPLYVCPARHVVRVNGQDVTLTLKEYEVLKMLLENQDVVLTRDQLLNRIWGYSFDGESRTVDVHIRTLRQKLMEAGELIETVRGVGYKIGVRP